MGWKVPSCHMPHTGYLWRASLVHDPFCVQNTLNLCLRLTTPGFFLPVTVLSSKSRDIGWYPGVTVISTCKPVNSQLTARSSLPALSFPTFLPRSTDLIDTGFASQGTTNNISTLCLLPHRDLHFFQSSVSAAVLPTNRSLCQSHLF